MLRAWVAAALLANLLFFGWVQGWFGPPPRSGGREPERLAAQVRPESVNVLSPQAASAAVGAALARAAACLETGPFVDSQLAGAETSLTAAPFAAGSWTREPVPQAPAWLVSTGRVADPATRRAREAELGNAKLAFEVLESPAELAPSLVLSRHATRAEAQAALAALAGRSVRGLRLVTLPAPPPQWRLRVAAADTATQARLRALPPTALAGGFAPCAARP